MRSHSPSLLLLTCLLWPAMSLAMTDPMRPAVATATAENPNDMAPPAGPVLQSTLVSAGQRSAVISGRAYRLGDRVGDARLEAIGPGWVRLQGPSGRTELTLSYSSILRRNPSR